MSKKLQVSCWLFVSVFLSCGGGSSAQAVSSPQKMIEEMTFGIRPPTNVKHWFTLISGLPRPPGGPKVYFMQAPARKPLNDRFAEYVQVAPQYYTALLSAAQSSGCDRDLRPPYHDFSLPKLPAITLSIHAGGRTREIVCAVPFGKVCAYLKSIENVPGQNWPKDVQNGLVTMHHGLDC